MLRKKYVKAWKLSFTTSNLFNMQSVEKLLSQIVGNKEASEMELRTWQQHALSENSQVIEGEHRMIIRRTSRRFRDLKILKIILKKCASKTCQHLGKKFSQKVIQIDAKASKYVSFQSCIKLLSAKHFQFSTWSFLNLISNRNSLF